MQCGAGEECGKSLVNERGDGKDWSYTEGGGGWLFRIYTQMMLRSRGAQRFNRDMFLTTGGFLKIYYLTL